MAKKKKAKKVPVKRAKIKYSAMCKHCGTDMFKEAIYLHCYTEHKVKKVRKGKDWIDGPPLGIPVKKKNKKSKKKVTKVPLGLPHPMKFIIKVAVEVDLAAGTAKIVNMEG